MANQSPFVITTLDSDGKQAKPRLELIGRAMPLGSYELEGAMRAEFTWYPGNAVATTQMLGAEEKPTTIKGYWKDKFIGSATDEAVAVVPTGYALLNGQPLASVFDIVKACEAMRLAGQVLRVEWGPIVRVGVMTRFKQNWLRFEDCEWEMEFQWSSRGEPQPPPKVTLGRSADSFAANIQAAVDRLKAALAPPGFQVIQSFTDAVTAAFDVIDDASLEMASAVSNATQQLSAPEDMATRALAAGESIRQSGSTIVTAVEGVAPLELINTATPTALGLSDSLISDTYAREIKTATRALQAVVAEQGEELRASLDADDLLAIFTARAPMDLREISQRYYDTPDEWRRLLSYNELDDSRVEIGFVIRVPRITGEAIR